MRIFTGNKGWTFQKPMALGLVPLLFLTSFSGCTARHLPDWSEVESVEPETKTEVRMYEDPIVSNLPGGRREIEGQFHSATPNSVTLQLEGGQLRTFQKPAVRKVLTRRPIENRWPGWVALIAPFAIYGLVTAVDRTGGEDSLVGVPAILSLSSIPFFYFADMEGIYDASKVPKRIDSPWWDGSPSAEAEKPKNSN